MNRTLTLKHQPCEGGIEVIANTRANLADPNWRRIALCTHESDAQDIVWALEFAHRHGVV